jgi:hypothetical protein
VPCAWCGEPLDRHPFDTACPQAPYVAQPVPAPDHTCPIAFGARHGLLAGSPVNERWCFSCQRQSLVALPTDDVRVPELLLWEERDLTVYYAPWDWVNIKAKVMLVGITAGLYQAMVATRETKRCLQKGMSNEEALRCADAAASFSGPMRSNLITMLDGIGLQRALGIQSSAQLFTTHHYLAAHVSAIDYPLFVRGRNYAGGSPRLGDHPTLAALVVASLGPRVAMVRDAIVIPLGKAAQEGVQILVDRDLIDPRRCLFGFPHPSGANGWRLRQYQERGAELRQQVQRAFEGSPAPDVQAS